MNNKELQFLYINEPVVLKFSTHSITDYLSKTAPFRCNMNCAQKVIYVAITDSQALSMFQQQMHYVHQFKPWS